MGRGRKERSDPLGAFLDSRYTHHANNHPETPGLNAAYPSTHLYAPLILIHVHPTIMPIPPLSSPFAITHPHHCILFAISPPTSYNQTLPSPTSDSPHYGPHTSTSPISPFPQPSAHCPSFPSKPENPRRIPSMGIPLKRVKGRSAFRIVAAGRRWGGRLRRWSGGASMCGLERGRG